MNRTFGCLLFASVCVGACCTSTAWADDDDEYETVIVRRKKVKPPTATVQVNVTVPDLTPALPVAPVAVEQPPAPPPPPEPPPAEAAEPRRLVRYFCKAWKDEDWERLWWAMTPQYRKKVSLKKMTELFTADAEANGGLKDENIISEVETNSGVGVKVELVFKFKRAKHRIVKAEVQRIPGGQYRMAQSAIMPIDLNDL